MIDKHHGPLRGRLGTALLELRADPEAAPTQALLSLPGKLRVDRPDEGITLLLDGAGWSCDPREPAVRLKDEPLAELERLLQHLRAVVLAPLYEATTIDRQRPGLLTLTLPGDEVWELELDEASLALHSLAGPVGAVRFSSFLDTGVTLLPAVVEFPEERVRHVKFRANPSVLHPRLFADPALPLPREAETLPRVRQQTVENPRELPAAPQLQSIDRRMFLSQEDPGSWRGRSRAIIGSGNSLASKGQAADGLPTYLLAASQTRLLIPFKPDEARGHQPYVRGPDDDILHVPQHDAVVLAPTAGTWDDVIERGAAEILEFMTAQKLQPDGPMLAVPFIGAGVVPSDSDLQRLRIRLEQRVRKRE